MSNPPGVLARRRRSHRHRTCSHGTGLNRAAHRRPAHQRGSPLRADATGNDAFQRRLPGERLVPCSDTSSACRLPMTGFLKPSGGGLYAFQHPC